jgi:hypothetical protein
MDLLRIGSSGRFLWTQGANDEPSASIQANFLKTAVSWDEALCDLLDTDVSG